MEYISGPVVAGQHFLEAMTRLMRMWEHIDTVWHNELNKKRNKSTPSPFYVLVGIEGGGAGSGSSGYYVVTAVDAGGTESVQSLAVKPASAVSSAAGSAGGAMACFIRAAGHPPLKPYLVIGLLLTVVVALGVWRSRKLRTEC